MRKSNETVRGIEAIKLYLPPNANTKELNINVIEEKECLSQASERPTPSTMTSVERYQREWVQLIKDLNGDHEKLCDLAFNCQLKMSKFRSLYWALLLRVLNSDFSSWSRQRKQQRKRYERLKQEFMKNPHNINLPDDNPLSQATQSIWNQYFSDQELFAVIRQDVVRTFPGVDFFRKDVIQNAMSNILFYHAREHPYMSYRQGMHEIVAPILFVVYSDHQSLLHFKDIAQWQNVEHGETLMDILNPKYLEEDSYSIFSRLMSSIESYYRISKTIPDHTTPNKSDKSPTSTEVEVIGQLNFIRDKILIKEDLHLHNYLLKLDIPLHLFGIRWLRLLFGREFALLDLLVLWDAIFADSDHFDLPNYILVAMLIRIRNKLLLSDYTTCLTFLMRYPANMDVTLILRHALHMKFPKKFERPSNAFIYFTPPANVPGEAIANSVVTNHGHPIPRERQSYERGAATASSLNDSTKVDKHIKFMQVKNAADFATIARLKAPPESARIVMDGYVENSPELMKLEMKNAQTIINTARRKLQMYMNIVRNHMGKQPMTEELASALDGIDELTMLLDVKIMFPLHARTSPPVDEALEANEQQRQNKSLKLFDLNTVTNSSTIQRSNKLENEDEQIEHIRIPDRLIPKTFDNSNFDTSYERPDTSFSQSSVRLLGNLKEIELITIASDEKIVEPILKTETGSKRSLKMAECDRNSLPLVDPLRDHVK